MSAGWAGLLGLTGVWPSSPVAIDNPGWRGVGELTGTWLTGQSSAIVQAGWMGVGELTGTWLTGTDAAITQAGWRGTLALTGVWIDGSGEDVISPLGRGGQTSTYSPRYSREIELQIAREDNEIIEILSILASRRLI